jgi:DNA relaxase NicK
VTSGGARLSLDWLTGVGAGDPGAVVEFVAALIGDGAEVEHVPGRWRFGKRVKVGGLVEVMWDGAQKGMPDWCVNVSGEACQWLGFHGVQTLAARSDRLTRVDAAWDGVPFTVAQAGEAFAAGDVRTRARDGTGQGPLRPKSKDGNTVTIGSREAGRQVCIYDRRGPVRFEFRLRRAHAAAIRETLLLPAAEVAPALLGAVRSYLEFVDAESDSNVSRRALLPWWEAFVGAVEPVRLVVERVATSIARRVRWLRESVAPTLSALVEAGLSIEDLLDSGRWRQRPAHRMLRLQAVEVGGWV